ncbi:MAG: hypothetical protein K5854_06770 [Prevotella sp.]|nr:hypothetical protein [Prevotella sp.]
MKRTGINFSRLLAAIPLLLICMCSMLSSCGNDDAEPIGINEENYAFLYDKAFMDSLKNCYPYKPIEGIGEGAAPASPNKDYFNVIYTGKPDTLYMIDKDLFDLFNIHLVDKKTRDIFCTEHVFYSPKHPYTSQPPTLYSNNKEYGKIYYVNKKPVKIIIYNLCELEMKYIKGRGIVYVITPLAKECDYYADISIAGYHTDLLTTIRIF